MVEARGIEPLSKNKIRTASTRLAKVKISSKKAHFPKPKFRLRLKFQLASSHFAGLLQLNYSLTS